MVKTGDGGRGDGGGRGVRESIREVDKVREEKKEEYHGYTKEKRKEKESFSG